MDDRERRIRERAHQIWEEEGRPDGREREHWERAAREIDAGTEPGVRERASEPSGGTSDPESGGNKTNRRSKRESTE